jgi:hydrogenase maturation protein HypF
MADQLPDAPAEPAVIRRRRISVRGTVQGVGFRPFVFRLANELGLVGSVGNDSEGVVIDIQGSAVSLDALEKRLRSEAPPLARIVHVNGVELPCHAAQDFTIVTSRAASTAAPVIPADVAVCTDCLAEMRDPADRRYRYPFINCTNCGPRYTITEHIPYDRPLTSMKQFCMCDLCSAEYHDPHDRRFHAQPNACPVCGPQVRLHDGKRFVDTVDWLNRVGEFLAEGKIVAVRSLGGFHLACDATNENAVHELRRRKSRPHKPFAIMCVDLPSARQLCDISNEEAVLLESPSRPIVLLRRKEHGGIATGVAPDTDRLGVMLPSAPLHYLICGTVDRPLVMTSGNLTDEPIVMSNVEALDRLADFADLFVLHDREIVQRVDDSIVMHAGGDTRVLRRARGIVPSPVQLPFTIPHPILACGGELKSTVAIGSGDQAVISQHLGDLDNPLSMDNFEKTIEHLTLLLGCSPKIFAHDLHEDYLSSRWAKRRSDVTLVPVQHHHAHLVSVMTECGTTEPCLGIILDGTGYGLDGTVWGGELLCGDAHSFRRLAWLNPVPMPGGEAAIREPWRMTISYLQHAYDGQLPKIPGEWNASVPRQNLDLMCDQIRRRVNSPMTSSCGRLFDGVSSMLNLCHQVSYEAQAAMRLELTAGGTSLSGASESLGVQVKLGPIEIEPLIREIWDRACSGESSATLARRFHMALAGLFVGTAIVAREETNINRIALSGGVFQNRLFLEYLQAKLIAHGFDVLTHRDVPCNDGGIALGQLAVANAVVNAKSKGSR